MIIDLILNRKENDNLIAEGYTHTQSFDGTLKSLAYDAEDFYRKVFSYHYLTPDDVEKITRAMDYGEEDDVKESLYEYVANNGYNPELRKYIYSVNWLQEDNYHENSHN